MIAQLEEVLRHQRDALVHLDGALTDVERQLAADDPPGLRAALVAVRAAADRAAALELTRSLALVSAGASPDLSVEAIGQALVARSGPRVAHLAAELRSTVDEVTARRRRILEALEARCGPVPAVDLGRPPRA